METKYGSGAGHIDCVSSLMASLVSINVAHGYGVDAYDWTDCAFECRARKGLCLLCNYFFVVYLLMAYFRLNVFGARLLSKDWCSLFQYVCDVYDMVGVDQMVRYNTSEVSFFHISFPFFFLVSESPSIKIDEERLLTPRFIEQTTSNGEYSSNWRSSSIFHNFTFQKIRRQK